MEKKVGDIIEQILKQKGMSKVEFARRLHTSNQNVHSWFKRTHFDTELLTKISKELEHDFFQYYVKPQKIYNEDYKASVVNESLMSFNKIKKTKVIIELELNTDDIIKLGLKERVLDILNE